MSQAPKRGRPKKKVDKSSETKEQTKPKKRGRKPKGGKIILQTQNIENKVNVEPNVIVHLKCKNEDLQNKESNNSISYYSFDNNNTEHNTIKNNTEKSIPANTLNDNNETNTNTKLIMYKLNLLQNQLVTNNINDSKSACFWCSCSFENLPIYIPKFILKKYYHVYGCFCSPECAAGFLMNENLNSSIKYERYHLLCSIYSKIFNYTKNIKPAPDPHYTLDKFYGNLSISEYRKLFNTNRFLFIIDKPITRDLPELHEDNNTNFDNNIFFNK
jgi:hypothetical protein